MTISHQRSELIRSGKYTEEIMSKAEEIAWQVHPRTYRNAFETWPEWPGATMQSHFAGLAKLLLAQEKESPAPASNSRWVPWALL